jgi:hypothetical protein
VLAGKNMVSSRPSTLLTSGPFAAVSRVTWPVLMLRAAMPVPSPLPSGPEHGVPAAPPRHSFP